MKSNTAYTSQSPFTVRVCLSALHCTVLQSPLDCTGCTVSTKSLLIFNLGIIQLSCRIPLDLYFEALYSIASFAIFIPQLSQFTVLIQYSTVR